MRISDWSSDVCSSDLLAAAPATDFLVLPDHHRIATQCFVGGEIAAEKSARRQPPTRRGEDDALVDLHQARSVAIGHRHIEGQPEQPRQGQRAGESGVGKEWVSTCIYRWAP